RRSEGLLALLSICAAIQGERNNCMDAMTKERLFGWQHAFDAPVTVGITIALAVLIVAAPLLIFWFHRKGSTGEAQHRELVNRYKSWLILIVVMVTPILLGAFWLMLGVAVLSILCYREFCHAPGMVR